MAGERKIALVCASNQNRSVETHALLLSKGYKNVFSFGTSGTTKLPGPSIDKPNIYPFGTPYRKIYDDLKRQNPDLYKANGLLQMLERNSRVKEAPERWQETRNNPNLRFDVVITFEERVFDIVIEDLAVREMESNQVVHVFNINTKDNHDEAAVGASNALQLIQMMDAIGDWEENIDPLIEEFQVVNIHQHFINSFIRNELDPITLSFTP